MDSQRYGLWIDGRDVPTEKTYTVYEKYAGQPVATVADAAIEDVRAAVAAAENAFRRRPQLAPYRRYRILLRVAELLQRDKETLARNLVYESGMPIRDARQEVDRGTQDFILAAEEAKRIQGEVLPIEAQPGSENRFAFSIRVPVGVVCAITPFNAPLSLLAHKVAPALAAGNTLVVKPPPVAPLTALYLARLLEEAGLPAGYYNVVTGSTNDVGEWLLADPRIRLYTFTGSAAVGQHIKAATGLRRVLLELGNNSGSIVCADADIDRAVPYIVRGSFRKAGQVCVSLQRLYVHRSREEELLTKLAPAVQKLVVGDPMDEATDVGPMISEQAAARAEAWVQEAVAAGARVVIGGTRQGTLFAPTILTGVTEDMKVVCEEIFAPVLSVIPFDDLDDAIDRLNNTPYGLQAGVFTESLETALYCARRLEFGGVNINDTSNYRADNLPYGGIKKSGIGKEGPKYAIREMTEERIVTINLRHRHYGPSEG